MHDADAQEVSSCRLHTRQSQLCLLRSDYASELSQQAAVQLRSPGVGKSADAHADPSCRLDVVKEL